MNTKVSNEFKVFQIRNLLLIVTPFLRNIFLHFLQCMLSITACTNGEKIYFLYRWLDNCVRCAAIPDPILYSCSSESTAKFLPQQKNIFWGDFSVLFLLFGVIFVLVLLFVWPRIKCNKKVSYSGQLQNLHEVIRIFTKMFHNSALHSAP